MGFRFFIERRSSRLLMCWLPVNLIWPTFTVGPSLMLKFTCTEAGGMFLTSGLMVANWCPCSDRISLSTVAARMILAGSYWLSTERPTFSFLKRSSTSETETEFRPL